MARRMASMRIQPKPNSAEDIRRYCHKLPTEALTWFRKQRVIA
jgi:hypothetical protein